MLVKTLVNFVLCCLLSTFTLPGLASPQIVMRVAVTQPPPKVVNITGFNIVNRNGNAEISVLGYKIYVIDKDIDIYAKDGQLLFHGKGLAGKPKLINLKHDNNIEFKNGQSSSDFHGNITGKGNVDFVFYAGAIYNNDFYMIVSINNADKTIDFYQVASEGGDTKLSHIRRYLHKDSDLTPQYQFEIAGHKVQIYALEL